MGKAYKINEINTINIRLVKLFHFCSLLPYHKLHIYIAKAFTA